MEKERASGITLALLLMGMLTLAFSIQLVEADGIIYIRADGSVDPPSAPIQRDGDIYSFTADIYDSIVVERSNILIDGAAFTLQGTESGNGFYWAQINNVTIRNTNIKDFSYGISVQSSHHNCFSGNNITNNYSGIMLSSSSSNRISGNYIEGHWGDPNSRGVAIVLYSSSSNSISGNDITLNTLGIYLNPSSNYNNISENKITDQVTGIGVYRSSNNCISGNNITSRDCNLWLDDSPNCTIFENRISGCYSALYIDNSSSCNFAGNYIYGGFEGFTFHSCSYCNVYGNNIMSGVYMIDSSSNRFYHNNFARTDVTLGDSTNVWDDGYPFGGNFWSGHVDVDERSGPYQDEPGNDGIWDHPYVVGPDNEDKYPLVNPWVPRTVGVQVGDWVKYSVETTGNRPGFPVDLNEVEWGKTTVKGVSGTIIDVELVWHLKNDTETATIGTVDVATSGYPGPSSMTGLFVSKDLPAGATLYATYPYGAVPPSMKINETVVKEYLGVNRETNHIDATEHGTHINAYWDKATGVLSEFTEDYLSYWSLHFKIVDTNLWRAPLISTMVDIAPRSLNLKSKGQWITAYIQLPEGYNPADIDASTILLNGTVSPVLDPKYDFVTNSSEYLVDYNNDGILERMVKFDRTTLESLIYNQRIRYGDVELTLSGKLFDGTPFEGTDIVFVNYAGDVNNDGKIDILDAATVSAHWSGPPAGPLGFDSNSDLNNDGLINILDSGIISINWGQTVP